MIYDKIIELVGAVPYGFEPVVYAMAVVVLVWVLSTFFSIVHAFFNMIGGYRNG